jgi:hypothetical protein
MKRQFIPPYYRELKDIPNIDGFELVGLNKDRKEVACYVKIGSDMCYHIEGCDYNTLISWRLKND